jgi:hypothetical protein
MADENIDFDIGQNTEKVAEEGIFAYVLVKLLPALLYWLFGFFVVLVMLGFMVWFLHFILSVRVSNQPYPTPPYPQVHPVQ